jgi:hypothetical protein
MENDENLLISWRIMWATFILKSPKQNMKNTILKLSYCLLIVATLFSCGDDSKSSPVAPTFKKEDLYGTWQEDNSTTSDGCARVIKVEATMFYFGIKCGTDFTFDNGAPFTYQENEFKFSSSGSYWRFKILSKTSTTFKTHRFVETADLGEYNYTKL